MPISSKLVDQTICKLSVLSSWNRIIIVCWPFLNGGTLVGRIIKPSPRLIKKPISLSFLSQVDSLISNAGILVTGRDLNYIDRSQGSSMIGRRLAVRALSGGPLEMDGHSTQSTFVNASEWRNELCRRVHTHFSLELHNLIAVEHPPVAGSWVWRWGCALVAVLSKLSRPNSNTLET